MNNMDFAWLVVEELRLLLPTIDFNTNYVDADPQILIWVHGTCHLIGIIDLDEMAEVYGGPIRNANKLLLKVDYADPKFMEKLAEAIRGLEKQITERIEVNERPAPATDG